MKIPPQYDRRRKLSPTQKEQIIKLYCTGDYTMRYLADSFGVSQKTICLIVNPEAKEKQYNYHKEHPYTYSNEHRNALRKSYREYKRKLYEEGKLIGGKE